MSNAERNRICIAILALGGEGGGVLAGWIQDVARLNGWLAQGTSVPGVAQRTGATVYYVELARAIDQRQPILAQMPVPGDVDIVIASEIMEAGRAMLRGFCTPDRTLLITSTHRVYSIAEKSAMGDGRMRTDRVMTTAGQLTRRFIGFDMQAASERTGSAISALMFGALAASEALPFVRDSFVRAIESSGIAVENNLAGFAEGVAQTRGLAATAAEAAPPVSCPTTGLGRRLHERLVQNVPAAARTMALHGVQRLMDYQDGAYAELYLERLEAFARVDRAPFELTTELSRHLALWMSYEDTIRVADLKTRAARLARVRSEVRASDDQLLVITEFMHPRLQEICETLPARLGRAILNSPWLSSFLDRFFRAGHHVETTSLRWFVALRTLAKCRRLRGYSLRFQEENTRIEQWLTDVRAVATQDYALAVELVRCQRLLKGYGDTFARGLRNYQAIRSAFLALPAERRTADWVEKARTHALSDEKGEALNAFLARGYGAIT